jgi:hypothetical protein
MNVTLADIGVVVAVIMAGLAVYQAMVRNAYLISKNSERLARIELKADTLWDFMMRRASSEAVMAGVATIKSPAIVSEEAKEWMKPLIVPIQEFYAKLGRRMTDNELAMEIERRFGDRILEEVCIPHGLHMGACLLIAMQAAKDLGSE